MSGPRMTALGAALLALLLAGCTSSPSPAPPKAKVVEHRLEAHGHTRVDPYYWINQRDNPDVIRHLEAENAYTEAATAAIAPLRTRLFEEIVGRIQPDDSTVPVLDNGYYTYRRYEAGAQYPLLCRRPGALDAPEEILLDGPALAEGQPFFAIVNSIVSPDNRQLAYAVDTRGRRICTWRFKNLTSGETRDTVLEGVSGQGVWAADSRTFFYIRLDPQTLRGHQVWRHTLGTDPGRDTLVYEEADDTYNLGIGRSKSRQYLFIVARHTVSTEYRTLPADRPGDPFQVFLPRERGHEYDLDHAGGRFYIRTNRDALNFRLVSCPERDPRPENWTELVPHRQDVLLRGVELFRDFYVLSEMADGLSRLIVRTWSGDEHAIDFGEPTYNAFLGPNPRWDAAEIRYLYTSLTTPMSTIDYHPVSRQRVVLKEDAVLGDFDRTRYQTERIWAEAPDGTRVPISLVYRADRFQSNGQSPLLLYGYGAYGASQSASFRSDRLSLLDRGFVFAIAHIRGGQEMGRQWYEDGKLLRKMNTFTDFIACAEHLVANGYADPRRLFAMGGSAGGLLVGAVVNLRPDLWRGAVAAVPFVDVVTTMLDASIPLTTFEYDEWGNPNDKAYYQYMLSYSPYDQLQPRSYPDLLVTSGLHDSQVQYWEPTKWVARMRDMQQGPGRILLHTNMTAGHGGASGRLERYRETALQYAFLLDLAGATD